MSGRRHRGRATPSAHLGDVGAAIVERARASKMGVVRDYGGHGIGRRMHMDPPHVRHVGERGQGLGSRPA